MTSSSASNGASGSSTTTGPALSASALAEYTKACQDVSGPGAHARGKLVLDALMKHLHAFATEVSLTNQEWLAACELLNRSGKISDDRRDEMILISDVLGLESLIDTIAHENNLRQSAAAAASPPTEGMTDQAGGKATVSAILGPFYRENAPEYDMDADIVQKHSIKSQDGTGGRTCYLYGRVSCAKTGKPIESARISVWHTAPNGFYEQQDEEQPDYNNRGVFTTKADGEYSLRCLVPTPYPIPYDGGAGDILKLLDRSPMRPAHIHFYIKAPGYKQLVTQIFDRECKYMGADAVFADKSDLTFDFSEPKCEKARSFNVDRELQFDIRLVPE